MILMTTLGPLVVPAFARSEFDANLRALLRHRRTSRRRVAVADAAASVATPPSSEMLLAERLLPKLHSACDSVEERSGAERSEAERPAGHLGDRP